MSFSKGWRAARTEMRCWFALSEVWAALLLLGAALTLTGAFDTHDIPSIFDRAMLFTVVMGIGGVLCVFATGILRGVFGISTYGDFRVAIILGLVSIPFGAVTGREIHGGLLGYEAGIELILRSCVHGVFVVTSMLGIMYLVRFRALDRDERANGSTQLQAVPRVPSYMQSDDHYLKMVYESGVEFMRANISECADSFGTTGLRCHKSYWVSREAVKTRKRQGRQLLLVLQDGTEIPVGRTYEKQVRAQLG